MKNLHTPIYRNSGYNLQTIENTKKAFADELEHPHEPNNYIYTRYRNPTVTAAEQQLMQIEESEWALLTQSGMAAIDLAITMFQEPNNEKPMLFFSEIYGGTLSYIDIVLKKKRGLNIQLFESENGAYNLKKLENILDKIKPSLIYFEAVSNPMIIVADVEKIIQLAKSRNIKIIVDNTFATPYLWQPLNDGVDLVIHSATKYFGGHGNLTAGAICGNNKELMKDAIEVRKWIGHTISSDDASRLTDYMKTFYVRMKQHCDNAFKLAKYFAEHHAIETVHYPGLKTHDTYNNANKLFKNKGFGAMITFDLAGKNNNEKAKNCEKFIKALENNIPLIPTLGDTETILLPVEAVWGTKYPFPGMIRLSVGIENINYLKNTFESALSQLI